MAFHAANHTANSIEARITGTGSAFPKKELTNLELTKRLAKIGIETSDEWIKERTGIASRRTSDTKDESDQNSSLGAVASKLALEMAGKTADQIDCIIYATCTPDTLVPSTACRLQYKIGAKNAYAFDLNAACTGFLYGVHLATQLIRAKDSKTVLVVGADLLSTITNWHDRTSCVLFGDGAGAVLIEACPGSDTNRILSSHPAADGNLLDLLSIEAGGSNQEVTPEVFAKQGHKIQMKGKEVFKNATRTLADYSTKALQANQMTTSDVDWFIAHQANKRILDSVRERLNLPEEKSLINIERFGNTSSGTIPTVLDEAVRNGKIKSGQTILMASFGAGLTYGSVLLRWGKNG
jgi:3-oxoacyl-[acyl-carrier-protein] synthase III